MKSTCSHTHAFQWSVIWNRPKRSKKENSKTETEFSIMNECGGIRHASESLWWWWEPGMAWQGHIIQLCVFSTFKQMLNNYAGPVYFVFFLKEWRRKIYKIHNPHVKPTHSLFFFGFWMHNSTQWKLKSKWEEKENESTATVIVDFNLCLLSGNQLNIWIC